MLTGCLVCAGPYVKHRATLFHLTLATASELVSWPHSSDDESEPPGTSSASPRSPS